MFIRRILFLIRLAMYRYNLHILIKKIYVDPCYISIFALFHCHGTQPSFIKYSVNSSLTSLANYLNGSHEVNFESDTKSPDICQISMFLQKIHQFQYFHDR